MPGRATPTSSAASPTPTARSATPPGCASSSSRSAASSPCGTCASTTSTTLVAASGSVVADGAFDGEPVDYVDGVVFSATESYLVLGTRSDEPGPTSDYTGRQIYYRSIQHDGAAPRRDRLTTLDYLWRWDTDWFWCSRAFGAQHPRVRRLWPGAGCAAASTGSSIALDRRFSVADRLEARQGRPPRERVVQDVEVPLGGDRRLPALVPARGADRADLVVPVAASQRAAVGAVPAAAR